MVSRRNFISIAIMMLVLFGLFQFSLVMKDRGNRYDTNEFISDSPWKEDNQWKGKIFSANDGNPGGDYVVYVGSKDSPVYGTVEQWCAYSKRNLMVCGSVLEYRQQEDIPLAILIDGEDINADTQMEALKELAVGNVPLIFCTLPDVKVVEAHPELMRLLGIDEVSSESVDIVGVHIFSGFLLGGEAIYQVIRPEDEKRMDLELSVPWYHTFSGTKSYIIGFFEEQPKETDLQPSLLWRYSNGHNQIFAVCGDYIKDLSGMGYLEAMISELSAYDIYPVVNAQTLSIVNFPCLSDENSKEIERVYSREASALYQDIIWPNLISLMESSGFAPTCFLTPQFEYGGLNKPSEEELVFYLKQAKEQNAEAGLSMKMYAQGSLSDKVRADSAFFREVENNYTYSSLYAKGEDLEQLQGLLTDSLFSGVTTIVADNTKDAGLFSFEDENVTIQGITHDASEYRYSDDLRLKGYETALAYSGVLLDLTDIAWPKDEEDEWQKRSEIFSANITTYWKPFKAFARTTATESDYRIRNFLALSYTQQRTENEITVSIHNFNDSAYFILRTHGEQIKEISGGNFIEIEENVFLVEAESPELTIELYVLSDHKYME